MFLYLEVMAMVRVFWEQQSISITLPLLIAITALSRFIILQGKEMDPSALVYESGAILLIAVGVKMWQLFVASDECQNCKKLVRENSVSPG